MEATQEIKARLDIVDLIAEYLTLKPAGSGAFKANCPFHQEKTPSFHISRPRQSWHCFGCDIGGDHFSFIERIEGMEFREALEFLAQKTGVTLPEVDLSQMTKKKRLFEVNDLAMRFFRAALHHLPQAEGARAYVAKRGIDELSSDLFHLGYAPESWSALTDALQKKGVTTEELLQAGLVIKRESGSGVYDRFRGRLLFPISDVHGHIVGFTGRILTDDKTQAKYLNSPETALYRKSAVLYGLDLAKAEIRAKDQAVIVEGNMDVLSSHQFGVRQVVAASGTALTAEQLALLKRFTNHLAIAFDQDSAGSAATVRGLDLARQQDFSIKIITLPPEAGKDPDEACRKDPRLWQQAIADAVSIMEWLYRQAFRRYEGSQPEQKKQIAEALLPEIQRIPHPVERDHWLKRLAKDLGVGESALQAGLGKYVFQQAEPPRKKNLEAPPKEMPTAFDPDRRIWALLLADRSIVQQAFAPNGLRMEEWEGTVWSSLYERFHTWYAHHGFSPSLAETWSQTLSRFAATLSPDEAMTFNQLALFSEHLFPGATQETLSSSWQNALQTWRATRATRLRKQWEEEMRQAERLGDTAKILEIAAKFSSFR